MYQLGLSISSMLGGLFSWWVDSLTIHEKMAGNRDAQSHAQIKIIANKTPPGLLLVGGARCVGQAMDWCLLVVGEYKLYHSAWEPPIMCAAWKISRSLGCCVDNESIPLKILFTSVSKNIIYLLLCRVIILFLKKAPVGEHHCHLHSLLLVYIEYDLTGSLLPWITMSSQSLVFKGALHLCFVVSERASEIPSCYIILWLFWESVVIPVLLLLPASSLCHWYE